MATKVGRVAGLEVDRGQALTRRAPFETMSKASAGRRWPHQHQRGRLGAVAASHQFEGILHVVGSGGHTAARVHAGRRWR